VLFAERAEVGFSGVEGEVSDIHFGVHMVFESLRTVCCFEDCSRIPGFKSPPNPEDSRDNLPCH
jgi:hypothetical protein